VKLVCVDCGCLLLIKVVEWMFSGEDDDPIYTLRGCICSSPNGVICSANRVAMFVCMYATANHAAEDVFSHIEPPIYDV
jgi:hypothetical protein